MKPVSELMRKANYGRYFIYTYLSSSGTDSLSVMQLPEGLAYDVEAYGREMGKPVIDFWISRGSIFISWDTPDYSIAIEDKVLLIIDVKEEPTGRRIVGLEILLSKEGIEKLREIINQEHFLHCYELISYAK